MAKEFLKLVAEFIHERYKDNVEKLCIVLPNKRGALFLKNHLAQTFGKTIWLPTIISAEDLITELSGLKTLEEIDLVCHLYESYKICYGPNAETFDSFAKWGQLILQDFNEIDRYLADSEQLYENLKDIKVIENWSLGEENLSEYQTNYLQFMNSLGAIYKHFSAFLLTNNWGYQGLAYKYAVINQDTNTFVDQFDKLLFCGFNALNAAELKIFYKLFEQKKADLIWDADNYYLKNPNQEAGLFLRNNFDLFKERDPLFIQDNFREKKDIKIISVPKQIGQAQVVKQTLQHFIDQNIPLDRVAVVLANEKLLWPVLQQLPGSIEHVNITMEYPLRYTSTYGFIELLIQLQLNFDKQKKAYKTIYHNDLINLFRQPIFLYYLKARGLDLNLSLIIGQINARNLSFISQKNLQQLLQESYVQVQQLLQPSKSIQELCETIQGVLKTCIVYFSEQQSSNQNNLELEYLQIILKNFNRLNDILIRYPHFNDIQSFKQLYTQVVGNSSAPFIGEPLRGLQIMGVLETRTLDFDHIILVNVNEGVLPSGKTINSFIPNDLKRAFGLPLYLEKDAIYAYHFYRLLQRAKDITITYDSETDTFGKGEKSRFVTQLQLEMKHYNSEITITEEVASYKTFPEELDNTIIIQKNDEVLKSILSKATSSDQYGGLSPSGLISYKECQLKFYFRYSTHLKETKEVEESAEANTFGSILHLSLETLYKDFTGKIITTNDLQEKLKLADVAVQESFISFFDNTEPVGKSILQQEVIKVYVKKLINNDIKFITGLSEENQFLTLNSLEKELSAALELKLKDKTETIYIKGKIDRVDSFGGQIRVIDYKSSVKDTDKFVFDGFEKLFQDKNYNKQFQLFIYAWLLYKNGTPPEKLMPCIVPFKVFLEEPKYVLGANKKPFVFTSQFFDEFETELKLFIASIFDQTLPFIQTDDEKTHEYCPYNVICNFKI
ncbi:PD-(D/E)XK nuclease family protein [Aurantibacillus circumpalustris]|uniref:PD-(D/E)XK nuclease family protein n=1 Tax=Aurantibacillus circumpalustris TaxID=3036359 RepID=UPI00295BC665|nr:PD-(D/E)XK nuclease family protein [Aurantibacillus circumpalustris]